MNLREFRDFVEPECTYVHKAIEWAMLTDDPFGDEAAPLRNQIGAEEARTLVDWIRTLDEEERSPKLQEFYKNLEQWSRGILDVRLVTKETRGLC